MNDIPNSCIGAVSDVLAGHYYSHSKINSLFMEAGAPGDVPDGNLVDKCTAWFKEVNNDPSMDGLEFLGRVIQPYMDNYSNDQDYGHKRIVKALELNGFIYHLNGIITKAGVTAANRDLVQFFKKGDFKSIEKEFERALDNIATDPYASVTAASSIIESLCKTILESNDAALPNKQTIQNLWRETKNFLSLNPNRLLSDDKNRVVVGLSSIVDGIGAFRTHGGSAHGRGIAPPKVSATEARLAVNASHTLVSYVVETWHAT